MTTSLKKIHLEEVNMPKFRKHFFQQLCCAILSSFPCMLLRQLSYTSVMNHTRTLNVEKNTPPPLILKSCTFLLSFFFSGQHCFPAQVTQKNWGWLRSKQTTGSPWNCINHRTNVLETLTSVSCICKAVINFQSHCALSIWKPAAKSTNVVTFASAALWEIF